MAAANTSVPSTTTMISSTRVNPFRPVFIG